MGRNDFEILLRAERLQRVAGAAARMTAPDHGPDSGPLLHPLDAAIEIGDAEQQVIGRRDGGPGSFHDDPGSGQRRRRDKAQRPDRGSTIDCRKTWTTHSSPLMNNVGRDAFLVLQQRPDGYGRIRGNAPPMRPE